MWRYTRRRLRNESVAWVVLLLLQQFAVVLASNVELMKDPSVGYGQTYESKGERGGGFNTILAQIGEIGGTEFLAEYSDRAEIDQRIAKPSHGHHNDKRDVRVSLAQANITRTIREVAEAVRALNDSIISAEIASNCNLSEHEKLAEQMNENPVAYPFFMASTSVFTYLQNCSDLVEYYARKMYFTVGEEESILILEMFSTLALDQMQNTTASDEQFVDPESEEHDAFNDARSIMATNIVRIEELSDVLLSMKDGQPARSYGDVGDELDQTIEEFEIMNSLYDEPEALTKRDVTGTGTFTTTTRTFEQPHPDLVTPKSSLIKIHNQRKTKVDEKLVSKLKDENSPILSRLKPSHQTRSLPVLRESKVMSRKRRDATVTNDAFFIKNDNKLCKVLAYDNDRIEFQTYDEHNIYRQLWLWRNESLQHYESGLFLHYTIAQADLILQPDIPATKIQYTKGKLSMSSCDIKQVSGRDNGNEIGCGDNNQTWSFVSLSDSDESISWVSCLFVVQESSSCLVLSTTTKDELVGLESLNDAFVEHHLWYWDGDFIRNSLTHQFLSIDDDTNVVKRLDLDESYFQQWKYESGSLLPIGTSDFIFNSSRTSTNSHVSDVNITTSLGIKYINDSETNVCENTDDIFALKNSINPCDVLCSEKTTRSASWKIYTLAGVFGAVTGILMGLLALMCKDTSKSTVVATCTITAIIMAVAAIVPIKVFNLFTSDVDITVFKPFEDDELCLWSRVSGKIKNTGTGKQLYLEEDSENGYRLITSDVDDTWSIIYDSDNLLTSEHCLNTLDITSVSSGVSDESVDSEVLVQCSKDKIPNYNWTVVPLDDSPHFFQNIYCLFLLPSQAKLMSDEHESCGVLSVKSTNGSSLIVSELPSIHNIFNQLWYRKNGQLYNIENDYVINSSISNLDQNAIAFKYGSYDSDIASSLKCTKGMFFMKDKSEACKVLSLDERGEIRFLEFNYNIISRQLWSWVDGCITNVETRDILSVPFISETGETMYKDWKNNGSSLMSTKGACGIGRSIFDIDTLMCTDMGDDIDWIFIPFGNDFEYADKVMCTFFIQSQTSPCGALTANTEQQLAFVAPFATDLLSSQLWYTSGNIIVHAESGGMLVPGRDNYIFVSPSTEYNGENDIGWSIQKKEDINQIVYANEYKLVNYENRVKLMSNPSSSLASQWRVVEKNSVFEDYAKLKCVSLNRNYMFIKSKSDPCKVLTGNGPGQTPTLQVFDEAEFARQLWYIEDGRVYNFENGDVLTARQDVDNTTDSFTVELSTMLYYDTFQQFSIDGNTIRHEYESKNFYLQIGSQKSLTCRSFVTGYSSLWTFVKYTDAFDDISSIMCIFYIESNDYPGEYVTGYGENMPLKVRSLVPELVEEQLFFWDGDNIIHKKSLMMLTGNAHKNNVFLSLETQGDGDMQRWNKNSINLSPLGHSGLMLDFDESNDGIVNMNSIFPSSKPKWRLTLITEENADPGHTEEPKTLYFIMSRNHPCMVLTNVNRGEEPTFDVFTKSHMEQYLWYYQNDHLINLESGLALMLENAGDSIYNAILWYNYRFADSQKWLDRSSNFVNKAAQNCPMHSREHGSHVTVAPDCDALSSDLLFIKMDEEGNFFEKVSCAFFFKSTIKPCELLTAHSDSIRPRPIHTDLIESQLWYWDNKYLANFRNDKFLALNKYTNRLYLSDVPTTEWTYSYNYLQPAGFNLYVTILTETGRIGVADIRNGRNTWVQVKRDIGVNNINLLHCVPDVSNPTVYVIRSEYDKCPVLVAVGQTGVGTSELNKDSAQRSAWLLDNNHIINVNGFALAKKHSNGVYLESKYAFEPSQRWTWGSENIWSEVKSYYGSRLYLTYSGSGVTASTRTSNKDKQRWKWYTFEQIKDDDKLLRCSRCYNKKEETAASVISWFPIIGWLYNIGRGIAYSVKKCPKVAMWAFIEGFIDLAMDIVTVVTFGAAAGVATGVKTAFKLGFKAGVKIAAKVIASMLKNALTKALKGLKNVVKGGIKQALKKTLSKAKFRIKSFVSQIKKFPRNLKAISVSKIKDMKSMLNKAFKFTTQISVKSKGSWKSRITKLGSKLSSKLKRLPDAIQTKLSNAGKKIQQKLKKFGNELAEKGERAIKKAENMKASKRRLRCKRAPGGCGVQPGQHLDVRISKLDFNVPEKALKMSPDVSEDMGKLISKYNNDGIKGQGATAGIRQNGEVGDIVTGNIDDLRNAGAKPKYIDDSVVDPSHAANDVRHVEEDLLYKLDVNVKAKCSQASPCDVMLFSKMSPCNDRLPPQAVPCLKNIMDTCKSWYINFATKCKIAFTNYWDDGLDVFGKGDWDDYFRKTIGLKTNKPVPAHVEDAANIKKHTINSALSENRLSIVNNLKGAIDKNIEKLSANNVNKELMRNHLFGVADDVFQKTNDIGSFWKTFSNNVANGEYKGPFKKFKAKLESELVKDMRITLNDIAREKGTIKAISDIGGLNDEAISFFRAGM